MKISVLFTAALVLSLSACGDKAAEGSGSAKASGAASGAKSAAPAKAKIASCNLIKAEGICREYGSDNVEAAGMDFLKGLCTGGEFKEEACPANDKKVGACVTKEGTKVIYNDGPAPMDAAAAEKACKEGVPAGEWKKG